MERNAPKPSPPEKQAASPASLPGHLAGLSVRRQVFLLSIWPLMEQVLGFCVGFVDTAIAGRLSVEATEAIAVAAYTGWLLALLFGSIGVGAAALVSRATGAKHRRLANDALGQSLILAVLLAMVIAVLLYGLAYQIGALMNLTGTSLQMAGTYLRVLAIAAVPHGLLYVSAACLRASGDTRTPFRILAIVNAVNVAASWLFVFGPEPFGGRGVAGIAYGTAVAWSIGAILAVRALLSGKSPIRLHWFRLRPNTATLRRIYRISLPQFIDSLIMWTGNFLVASLVG